MTKSLASDVQTVLYLSTFTTTPRWFWDCIWEAFRPFLLGGFIVSGLVCTDWMCICVCVEGSDLKISLQAALSNNFPEPPGFGCRLPRLAAYAEYRFPSLTLCPRLFGNEGQIRCLFSLPQMLLIGGAPRLLNRRTCFQALGRLRWLPSCSVAFIQ